MLINLHQLPYKIRDFKIRDGKSYIRYECRFKNCNSFFKILIRDKKMIDICCEWEHNHSCDELFVTSHFLLIDDEIKKEIISLRADGASPGFVRSKFNLSITPSQLYNIARKAILGRFKNEIPKLHNAAKDWNNDFHVIFHEDSDIFGGITLINRRIIQTNFASDIAIIDDTMCTNRYKFPVVPCYCIDENDNSQLLAFGIIIGKTTYDFCQFLGDIAKFLSIRVFVCDRLEAQRSAIEQIFPEALICFCRVHIERNIRDVCGNCSNMHNAIRNLFKGTITTQEYLNILETEISKNTKAKSHLLLLKKHLKYYDPEIFSKKICEIITHQTWLRGCSQR